MPTSTRPTLAERYDAVAPEYEALCRRYHYHAPGRLLSEVAVHAQPSASQRVLDLGIGTGRASELDAAACARVVGLDVSPQRLATARSRVLGLGDLRLHDIEQPLGLAGVGEASADVVVSCGALHFS